MARIGFSQARTGRRARKGNNFDGVENLRFTPGKSNRLILPLKKDEDGSLGLVLFAQTIHRLNRPSIIEIPRKEGKPYNPYTFRCTHPYSQQTQDDAVKIAKREEMCVLCELENLQNRRRLDIMKEEFGTEEKDFEDGFENFKALTNKEKKAFFETNALDVEKPYYEKEDADGEKFNAQTTEMYVLAMELETEEKIVKRKSKKTGRTRKAKVSTIVLGDNGLPEYKAVLMKVSGQKLMDFKQAVDTAIEGDTLSYDHTFPYIENPDTEFEEEVLVGWVDFKLDYPEGSRMESARNMKISAMPETKSVLLKHPDLKEEIEKEMDTYYKNAANTFNLFYKHLRMYKREEVLALLEPKTKAEFLQLREEYRNEKDDEFEQQTYEKVLETNESDDEEKDSEQTEGKKETTKKSTNKSSKSKEKEDEVKDETDDEDSDEDLLEDDIDIDDEMFD